MLKCILGLTRIRSRENKISEIKLELPGGPLFARKQSKTFEEATDQAIDALKKQITKHKQKIERCLDSQVGKNIYDLF